MFYELTYYNTYYQLPSLTTKKLPAQHTTHLPSNNILVVMLHVEYLLHILHFTFSSTLFMLHQSMLGG